MPNPYRQSTGMQNIAQNVSRSRSVGVYRHKPKYGYAGRIRKSLIISGGLPALTLAENTPVFTGKTPVSNEHRHVTGVLRNAGKPPYSINELWLYRHFTGIAVFAGKPGLPSIAL